MKLLARQGGKAVGAASEVDRLGRDQHPHAGWNRDHVVAFTARSTAVSVAKSIPGATRTVAAPITISIAAVPPLRFAAIGACEPGALARQSQGRTPVRSPRHRRLSPVAWPPPRLAPPAEQLLRRQSVSSRDSRHLFAATIAFGDDLRLLRRRPRTASPGAGKYLQPAHRLHLGFVQKLSVRHVSSPLDSAGPTFADRRSSDKGGSQAPLTADGLPIGSGEIESAHRCVAQQRLKRSGAWWRVEHAEHMLALRINRINGDWDAYWKALAQSRTVAVANDNSPQKSPRRTA